MKVKVKVKVAICITPYGDVVWLIHTCASFVYICRLLCTTDFRSGGQAVLTEDSVITDLAYSEQQYVLYRVEQSRVHNISSTFRHNQKPLIFHARIEPNPVPAFRKCQCLIEKLTASSCDET